MSFADWWGIHKSDYKGIADWKDTKYSFDCREKGTQMATGLKTGLSLVIAAAALYM